MSFNFMKNIFYTELKYNKDYLTFAPLKTFVELWITIDCVFKCYKNPINMSWLTLNA